MKRNLCRSTNQNSKAQRKVDAAIVADDFQKSTVRIGRAVWTECFLPQIVQMGADVFEICAHLRHLWPNPVSTGRATVARLRIRKESWVSPVSGYNSKQSPERDKLLLAGIIVPRGATMRFVRLLRLIALAISGYLLFAISVVLYGYFTESPIDWSPGILMAIAFAASELPILRRGDTIHIIWRVGIACGLMVASTIIAIVVSNSLGWMSTYDLQRETKGWRVGMALAVFVASILIVGVAQSVMRRQFFSEKE